jgi:hypothetical protein
MGVMLIIVVSFRYSDECVGQGFECLDNFVNGLAVGAEEG